MRYKYFDAALFQLMLIVAIISGHQFFFVPYAQNIASDFETLAYLSNQNQVVRHKSFDSLAWIEVLKGKNLAQDDLIFTDENSSADILFVQGGEFAISENTLFKITKTNKNAEIKLEDGLLHFKLTKQNSNANFLLGNKNIEFNSQNADVQILTQNSISKISVIAGDLELAMDGEITKLQKDEFAKVDATTKVIEKEKVQLELDFPKSGSEFYYKNLQSLRFTWKAPGEVLFELARDRKFSEIIHTQKATNFLTVNGLTKGSYYWRVTQNETSSMLSSFRLLEIAPVLLLTPENRSMLSFQKPEESELLFKWSSQKVKAYEIQISNPSEKISKVVNDNFYIHKNLNPGSYRWRVRSLNEKIAEEVWSDYFYFEIEANEILKPTTLEGPDDEIRLSFYEESEIKSTPLTYSWKRINRAKAYNWVLKNEAGNIVSRETTAELSLIQNLMREGVFTWSVAGIDYFDKVGEVSESRKIIVELLKADYDEKTGSVKIVLKKPNQQVKFEWEKSPGKNLFEVSSDPSFKKIVHTEKTNDSHANFSFPKLGTYYWRTKKISSDGKVIYSKPKKVKIEPTPPPEKLEEVPDLELEIEHKKTTSTFDWFIQKAFADYDFVRIKWPVVEEMKGYVVEIYSDQSMSKLILRRKVKDHFLEWQNPPAGDYYYRVAQIDFWDRTSDFSDLAHITVKAKTEVEGKVVKIPAPKPKPKPIVTAKPVSKPIVPKVEVPRAQKVVQKHERIHPQYLRFYDYLQFSYAPSNIEYDVDDDDFNANITGGTLGTFVLKGRSVYKKNRFYDYSLSWQKGKVFSGNNSWLNSDAKIYMARPYSWGENKFVGKYGIMAKYISTYKMRTNELLDDSAEAIFSFATAAEFEFGSRKRLSHHITIGAAIGQIQQLSADYELRLYHFKNFIIHLDIGGSFSMFNTKTASNTLIEQKIGVGISFYFPPKLEEFISSDFWTSSPEKIRVEPRQGAQKVGR